MEAENLALRKRVQELEREAERKEREANKRIQEEKSEAERKEREANKRVQELKREAKRKEREANKRIQEEKRESKRKEREANKRAQEEQREARLAKSVENGTYFAEISDIWGIEWKPYAEEHFRLLKRASRPNLFDYNGTFNAALNENLFAADSPRLSKTSSEAHNADSFPFDVFGNDNSACELAHLMPVSAVHACLWANLICLIFGVFPWDVTWLFMQKLIHGTVDGNASRSFTGLKHSDSNKIRLKHQEFYFDHYSCLLVVPILSLTMAKNWNGEGYEAIVLAGAPPGTSSSAARVYRDIVATEHVDVVDPSSVEYKRVLQTACDFLEVVILAMAHSLHNVPFPNENLHQSLHESIHAKLNELKHPFVSVGTDHATQVPVPILIGTPITWKPVRKFTFSSNHGSHRPPDPLLLAMKSASNWTSLTSHLKLMATGECEDEEDLEEERRAEQEILPYLQVPSRALIMEDLVQGLSVLKRSGIQKWANSFAEQEDWQNGYP